MDAAPFWAQVAALVILLVISGFFSIAETAMMALNRFRLRHLAKQGNRSARLAQSLLLRTDRLLGMILIGNTLMNAAITALVTALAIGYFGNDETVITVATGAIAFVIIVFSEITPKVIGAAYPERIALPASYVLKPLQTLFYPVVWFVNLFVNALLGLMHLNPQGQGDAHHRLSPQELRSLVLEAEQFGRGKPRQVLLNLFDLEEVTVDDVMTPRGQIEALDLEQPMDELMEQLATCYHNKLPVYEGEINRVRGLLHVRNVIALMREGDLTRESLIAALREPYFVPSGTSALQQLQRFQESRRKIALVVDEYGEVVGLLALEDIIEELVGEFTTNMPRGESGQSGWGEGEQAVVEGSALLRDLNRRLGLKFALDGPTTLNGLILEWLQDIPDAPLSVEIDGVRMEVLQVDDQAVKSVRLLRPKHATGPE